MINQLESQGVIRKMRANEQSEFCAPSGFVPKKSGKLRFVIDFTALNKYVKHPFPRSPHPIKLPKVLSPVPHTLLVWTSQAGTFRPYYTLILRDTPRLILSLAATFSWEPPKGSQVQVITLIVPPTNSFLDWVIGWLNRLTICIWLHQVSKS